MEQRLTLQQKLLQKLSPQQIQVIKLLEIPTMQLEQRIKKELEENPVLEMESDGPLQTDDSTGTDSDDNKDSDNEEFTVDDYYEDDEIPTYKLNTNNYSKDDKYIDIPFSVGTSFHEFLYEQLRLVNLSEKEQELSEYIIGNIDDDGYLRRDLMSISDDLAFNMNLDIPPEELKKVLYAIQEFDPPGVAARDLRECLLLQLKRKEGKSYELAKIIVKDYFVEFTKKHYDKISSKLELTDEELKEGIDQVLKLNPKPGSSYSNPLNKANQHIVPDFILDNIDGELNLSLNQRNVPNLIINDTYQDMLHNLSKSQKNQKSQKSDKEAMLFVKQKLDSAKWFIDAIQQRQTTLLLTMSEIISFQKEYFQDGDETKLRPMILKDIAEKTSLDISTISRVSNSKYIQTHFGIYPLKYFFSEGLQKDDGEEVSTREIKKILQECIENEDKHKPLTDEKLAKILKEKTYNIARRTVAKYREQLGVPVARLRKEL